MLSEIETRKLLALAQQRAAAGLATEVVVYFLWDRHTDLTTQTRESVPDLAPEAVDGAIAYYPVIQGDISALAELVGHAEGLPYYRVQFQFTEGTVRRP